MITRRTFLTTTAFLLILGNGQKAQAAAHKFHASFTTIEFNPEHNLLEISLRVFSDDLENALSRQARRRIELDRTPDAADLAGAYVQERFKLRRSDGTPVRMAWVGMEQRVDMTWLYIEAPAPHGFAGLEALVTVFFELFRDQKNNVSCKGAQGKRHDILFRSGDNAFKPLWPVA
ncbi:MAG: DUF6702 family protein [Acidobacteriota bacterium]